MATAGTGKDDPLQSFRLCAVMAARVGLIGHPVAHSISPAFQQAAFDAVGFDARYEAWDVLPDGLASLIEGLRGPDALGANVTIPYKEAAAREMDRLHQTARHVGAINTIVRGDDGLEADHPHQERNLRHGPGVEPAGAVLAQQSAHGASDRTV